MTRAVTAASSMTAAVGPAPCPARMLTARQIELLLEFGDAREQAYVQEQLRCTPHPAVLQAAIAWYLDRDENAMAAHWAAVADAKGLGIQPWQRMLLALRQHDKERVRRVLSESGDALPVNARIEALKYLGKNDEALVLARHAIVATTDTAERERMERLARTLELADAPSLQGGFSALDYGPLSIRSLEAGGEHVAQQMRVGWRLRLNELDSSAPSELSLTDGHQEQDLSLRLTRTFDLGTAIAEVGANFRRQDTVGYGSLELQRELQGDPLQALRLRVALNTQTYETAMCRAYCTKSLVSAAGSGGFSPWDFFNLFAPGKAWERGTKTRRTVVFRNFS